MKSLISLIVHSPDHIKRMIYLCCFFTLSFFSAEDCPSKHSCEAFSATYSNVICAMHACEGNISCFIKDLPRVCDTAKPCYCWHCCCDTFPRINYNGFCQHNRAQRENIKVIILWEYFECTNEQQYTRIRFYPFERKKTSKYSLYNGKRKRISLCDRKTEKKTAILVIWVMNTQCVDTNWKTKECTLNAWEIEKGYWEWDFTMQQ